MTKHKLNISLKEYNETCLFLESIDFVRWDRLHVTPKDNSLTVYGWIKNSKPRDFMIVLFEYSKKSSRVTTSSLNPKIVKKLETTHLGTK